MSWLKEPATFIFLTVIILDLMAYGETPHYLIDLDLDLISDLSLWDEDYKTLNPGNAVAFTSYVLDLNIILFSCLNRGRRVHGGLALFTSIQNQHHPLEDRKFRPCGLLQSAALPYRSGS